ncbi:MAG: signal peptidase I [Clostridiales bacterium]|nr:signal peptidase I [Clostridiales bacterium]
MRQKKGQCRKKNREIEKMKRKPVKEGEKDTVHEIKGLYIRLVCKIVIGFLVCWILFFGVFGIFTATDESMYPYIRDGDILFYYRLAQDYSQDDTVVYEAEKNKLIGRIVAGGGDTVDFTEDGYLMINGSVQQEEFFFPVKREEVEVYLPCIVPEDSVFILCDYRTDGKDSRQYGTVEKTDISGRIFTLIRRRGF